MTVRYFIMQAHYRSTLDFSNEGLKAAEKGLARLQDAWQQLQKMEYPAAERQTEDPAAKEYLRKLMDDCNRAMADDFNTAVAIAGMQGLAARILQYSQGEMPLAGLGKQGFEELKLFYGTWFSDILGLKPQDAADNRRTDALVELVLELRKDARERKDWAASDKIRDALKAAGIAIKDTKEGTLWSYEG